VGGSMTTVASAAASSLRADSVAGNGRGQEGRR
jgi:hypothetical protein